MISIAPSDVVPILYPAHSWIISVLPPQHFRILPLKMDPLRRESPMITVLALAGMQLHLAPDVIATKHAGERTLVGDHGAVKNAVGGRQEIARNDGVATVSPYNGIAIGGFLLPRDVRQGFSNDDRHEVILS